MICPAMWLPAGVFGKAADSLMILTAKFISRSSSLSACDWESRFSSSIQLVSEFNWIRTQWRIVNGKWKMSTASAHSILRARAPARP